MISHNPEAERRFNAVKRLQQNLTKTSPGSYWSKVYEKALDFALSDQRAVETNFYYRVVDDAKRTLRRNGQTGPCFVSLYSINHESEEVEIENPLFLNYITPEQEIIYKQSVTLLRSACLKNHRHSLAVFYSMLEGYTVVETAQRLSISESMVKKLRSQIIKMAKSILLN